MRPHPASKKGMDVGDQQGDGRRTDHEIGAVPIQGHDLGLSGFSSENGHDRRARVGRSGLVEGQWRGVTDDDEGRVRRAWTADHLGVDSSSQFRCERAGSGPGYDQNRSTRTPVAGARVEAHRLLR
jgi:hypothetical protein